MDRIVTIQPQVPASYAERRAAMADETRTRILEACVAILARGIAELSIPAVAREAGVSVPTVYRNFADKKTLIAATAEYLRDKRGAPPEPKTLDELPEIILGHFSASSSLSETVRAALVSEPILAARRDMGEQKQRMDRMERVMSDALKALPPRDREQAVRVATVLCSSLALNAFRTLVGSTPEQAAESVAWTIARILGRDSLEQPARKKGSKR
jgi:AcrR family transcriptional regulator